jgi:hypothetical protein
MKFLIYNRWGQNIFESNNQNIGWDDKFKGEGIENAVFACVLEVKLLSGKALELKGDISLIK